MTGWRWPGGTAAGLAVPGHRHPGPFGEGWSMAARGLAVGFGRVAAFAAACLLAAWYLFTRRDLAA